jgi:hypothetical protein
VLLSLFEPNVCRCAVDLRLTASSFGATASGRLAEPKLTRRQLLA